MDDLKTAGEKFDIVFLDAPKDQYIPYHKFALDMVTPGGYTLWLHHGGQLSVRAALRWRWFQKTALTWLQPDGQERETSRTTSGAFKGGRVYYKTKKISVKEFLYDILYNPWTLRVKINDNNMI